MDYKEIQKINSPVFFVLYLICASGILVGCSLVVFDEIKNGESFFPIVLLPVFMLLLEWFVFYLVFQTELEIEISKEGFAYKYFPILRKTKKIAFAAILSWQIKKVNMFHELGGLGYRKTLFTKKSGYIMHFQDAVEFILADGRTKVFSVENAAMIKNVLRKYIAEKEIAK